jgi:hypothetical protein
MFSLQQNWRRGQNRFCLEAGVGGVEGRDGPNIVYTYESKKKKKKEKRIRDYDMKSNNEENQK